MSRLLALDLETTDLAIATARVTEVAVALYDVDRRQVLSTHSAYIRLPEGVAIPEKIQRITGIREEDTSEFGVFLPDALLQVSRLAAEHHVDRLVGHNLRAFDLGILRAEVARMSAVPAEVRALLELPTIDTMEDPPYPEEMSCRKLLHLAAEHGFLPAGSHRALNDALTSLRLLTCYPLDEVLRRADSPTITVYAHQLPYDRRGEAQAMGFRWRPESHGKVWWKAFKECEFDLAALRKAATFEVRVMPTPKAIAA